MLQNSTWISKISYDLWNLTENTKIYQLNNDKAKFINFSLAWSSYHCQTKQSLGTSATAEQGELSTKMFFDNKTKLPNTTIDDGESNEIDLKSEF